MSDSFLKVVIDHRVGALTLHVDFCLDAPWTVLFGPSGSGKTTILCAIAGFLRPNEGTVTLRGTTLFDADRGVSVPPHSRRVRTAGQRARLFPMMSVRENLHYAASPRAVSDVVGLFRLDNLLNKKPHALSGGESQRVSVARTVASAAAAGAQLLLLDEPFGGLDFTLRDALAIDLRDWLKSRGIPVLSVTHDVGEAFLLGAEVLGIVEGRIVSQGPAVEVLAGERTRLMRQLGSI